MPPSKVELENDLPTGRTFHRLIHPQRDIPDDVIRIHGITLDKLRVTFRDGRQLAGFSSDHRASGIGFFVVPADNRTNTERIFIYRASVDKVSVE